MVVECLSCVRAGVVCVVGLCVSEDNSRHFWCDFFLHVEGGFAGPTSKDY